MTRLAIALLIALAGPAPAFANWQVYHEDDRIIASFDYVTFAPFRNQPSVWVRWHNVSKKDEFGGRKIQFAADCEKQRLFEINSIPYDHKGNFLEARPHFDSPQEYRLRHNKLNEATYRLLCRQGQRE